VGWKQSTVEATASVQGCGAIAEDYFSTFLIESISEHELETLAGADYASGLASDTREQKETNRGS